MNRPPALLITDAKMIETLGFKSLLGLNPPSLPNILESRYFQVRNVGFVTYSFRNIGI
ncbi:MAG: hypothetical protein QGM50_10215 [Anaerolineae bacterium]|nr:hypothetical protein [Anaerolineae bacterium]